MTSQAALKGSNWGELAPVRATERGLLFSRLQIALGWANLLSVIATRCHLSPRRGSLLPNFYLSQPFRLLATLVATSPFSGDITYLRNVILKITINPYMLPERELAKSRQ